MKTCPSCGECFNRNPHKFGLFRRLSLTSLGEFGALVLAGSLLVVVPALSFAGAFGIGLLVIFGLGIYVISMFRGYKCAKCGKVFKKEDLQIV